MKYLITLILGLTTLFSISAYSQTQPVDPVVHRWQVTCMDTGKLHSDLETEFGETMIMKGEGIKDDHFELWATRDGRFTLVLSPFEGMSCVAFFGGALRLMRNLGPEL